VTSDSAYVINGIQEGWARKWQANGWMKPDKTAALNSDLWGRLLRLCDIHTVDFEWVRGHNGHAENERCDALALRAAKGDNLPPDEEYETAGHVKRASGRNARGFRAGAFPPPSRG
jgi:ribonuclease HI